MAYEIRLRTEADYRWYRFEAPPELLGQLDHNLKIADGVLRFRLFRVDPNSPVIAPPASGSPAPRQEAPEEPSQDAPEKPAPEEPEDAPEEEPQDTPEEAAEETPEETPAG
jgi:ribosomal S6-like protein